ncbi:MAG: pseudouridylate synthase, partial [Candidatus Falkowbacteria bacterium]|nr:pseudouridylate synthase [Candidatus Falkowbacteria bacterium]
VILTNDGEYAQKVTHPSFEHEKEYLVKVKTKYDKMNYDLLLSTLEKGVIDEGDYLVAKEVKYLGNNEFKIILTLGKKRHIKRMFKAVGCEVVDLLRVRIGDIKLGGLKEGKKEYFGVNK